MTPIIPAFTVSERSLITADNDRGFTPIGLNPANELAPWRDTIRQCGAVFLNRAFGMSEKGYRTHDLNCYGREAGLTFPLGPEWGAQNGLGDLVAEWCDEGVEVIVYCGGLVNFVPVTDLAMIDGVHESLAQDAGLPDHANVVYCFDNKGEAATIDNHGKPIRTPTMYAIGALRAFPHERKVYVEPTARGFTTSVACESAARTMNLWDRQRAAIAEHDVSRIDAIGLAELVFVSGNKPTDPKMLQLTTPEARIAEAKYHASGGYCSRVALATAGIDAKTFGKVGK